MIKELIRGIDNCACGRSHRCPVERIEIGSGALEKLPEICSGYAHILLVCDDNTWLSCAQQVYGLLEEKIEDKLILAPNAEVVIPNEEKIAEIENALTPKTQLILGVGSGVINDLCKYVSFFHDLPYYIVATAPSMDGYVSVGAAMILGGMKVTVNARPPKAVIADTEVLKNAPMPMLQAGYGDIIGKFSCLNDWKLGALIHGEYFCQRVYDMTMDCAQKVSKMASGVLARDGATVTALMEALVIVGVAMSYVDSSRPASGSEHHLSHFFEITGILEGKEYFAHGIDVAYSSIVTAQLREKLLVCTPQKQVFDRQHWQQQIRRVYATSADGVIALQDKLGWHERDDYPIICQKWEQIREVLRQAPDSETFRNLVEAVGLRFAEFEKLYGQQKIRDAVDYAKDLKDRYTVLWLYSCVYAHEEILFQAHRGVSTEYPENTMPAFEASWHQGYRIIETDPAFTADGKCVLFHDGTVNRTCRQPNGDVIPDAMHIRQMTWEELSALDAGLYMGEQFRGTKVPLLCQALAFAAQKNIHVKIDNKFEHFTWEQKEALFQIVEDSGADVGFSCANMENIQLVVQRFPKATIHYDGYVDEQKIAAIKALLKDNRLVVWLALPSRLTSWVQVPTASAQLCQMVKKYAELGLWILETQEQLQQAKDLGANIIETTGALKPR